MIAKIYQDGKYCESIEYWRFQVKQHGTVLYNKGFNNPTAIIPHSMMIIFDNSGNPDYDKIGKELRENKS